MKIKIVRYFKLQNSNVKGFADIEIMVDGYPLTICAVRVVSNKTGGHFYGLPQRQVDAEYKPICGWFTKDSYKAFHESMDIAFKEWFKNPENNKPVVAPAVVFQKPDPQDEPDYGDDCPF